MIKPSSKSSCNKNAQLQFKHVKRLFADLLQQDNVNRNFFYRGKLKNLERKGGRVGQDHPINEGGHGGPCELRIHIRMI